MMVTELAGIDRQDIDTRLRVLDPIFTAASAYSSKLSGLLENSRPLFWNMRKAK